MGETEAAKESLRLAVDWDGGSWTVLLHLVLLATRRLEDRWTWTRGERRSLVDRTE